jgi:hypothetical protein
MKIQRCIAMRSVSAGRRPAATWCECGGEKEERGMPVRSPIHPVGATPTRSAAPLPTLGGCKADGILLLGHTQYSGCEGEFPLLHQDRDYGDLDVLVEEHGISHRFRAFFPFDPPDPVMGGNKKSATVKAATPGCYMYSFQASDSTGIYGMSKASQAELIVISGQ